MRQGWGERELDLPRHPVADWAARAARAAGRRVPRRAAGASRPAGSRCAPTTPTTAFRADSAHVHLPATRPATRCSSRGAASRSSTPAPARRARPTSSSGTAATASCGPDDGRRCRRSPTPSASRSATSASSTTGSAQSAKTRVLRDVDAYVDRAVSTDAARDQDLARVLSEMRLVKDAWELEQLQEACDITTLGFADSVREWDNVDDATASAGSRARSSVGPAPWATTSATTPSSPAARHATTLHWTDNSGPITPGELVLLDMGVEGNNLYTADVTRTLPVDGRSPPLQRDLYSLVLAAQQAGIDTVRPGADFQAPHDAAMRVLAHGLEDLGLLPVSAEEALVAGQQGLHALDAALDQPHARARRARLRGRPPPRPTSTASPQGGHGADRRAGPLLPGGRPAGPRGAARHRHPHRGRHRGHRRRVAPTCPRRCRASPAAVEEWMAGLRA